MILQHMIIIPPHHERLAKIASSPILLTKDRQACCTSFGPAPLGLRVLDIPRRTWATPLKSRCLALKGV